MDEQDSVSLVPLQQVVESLLIVIDVGIAADVARRHRQLAAPLQQLVDRHVGQATAIGDDGEPLPLRVKE